MCVVHLLLLVISTRGEGDFLFDSFPVIYIYTIQYIVVFYQQASLLVVLYLLLCDKTMYMDVCTVRTVCILYCQDRTTTHTHVRMHIHTVSPTCCMCYGVVAHLLCTCVFITYASGQQQEFTSHDMIMHTQPKLLYGNHRGRLIVLCRVRMRTLFTLLLTALTATSGEDTHTHYSEGEGHLLRDGVSLLPSGLAGSSRQEGGTSLTWSGGLTTGEGERERNITTGHTCQSLTERRESERSKGVYTTAITQGG